MTDKAEGDAVYERWVCDRCDVILEYREPQRWVEHDCIGDGTLPKKSWRLRKSGARTSKLPAMLGKGAVVIQMVDRLREELINTRSELNDVTGQRDAFEHELALCEQDLRHALTRISELCEQLEALKAGLV